MVGKKSGRAMLREEGLARTDNNLRLSTWPHIQMINQKNYYTEYLKRDDQFLALRTQHEENLNKMAREAQARDRAISGVDTSGSTMDIDDDINPMQPEAHGSKIIVIHPGSQNLRVGLANDALPKTVPMVIARQWPQNESEDGDVEPQPKRLKPETSDDNMPEKWFGNDFAEQYESMQSDLKLQMRAHKRRVVLNSKELAIKYNRLCSPEEIKEHNDPLRVDWTEIPPRNAPEYVCGKDALRIPDQSRPRYKLFWPIRHGTVNEKDYTRKNAIWDDFFTIISEAIKTELGIRSKKELRQYSCVFIIPDLYERVYVATVLDALMRDFEFKRVCFMQESLAATFGAGWSTACIVDIGAQTTSICCVDEGLCLEESRINLKYGGADVTELFIKMMLYDHFPYPEINLRRRYDWLLAEELKHKLCTANEADIVGQAHEFHLRVSGQDTKKYMFKTYDEVILAPMGFFRPQILNNGDKLRDRRKLIDRSYDLYDNSPNDPTSPVQDKALDWARENLAPPANGAIVNGHHNGPTPKPLPLASGPRSSALARLVETNEPTPRSSAANSPTADGTPQPGRDSPTRDLGEASGPTTASADMTAQKIAQAEANDRIVPIMPLDNAILDSIRSTYKGDDRKARDFYGGILLVGGGAKFPYFTSLLEERLRGKMPEYPKEILIGEVPRELDPQLVVWKGGSVFARLSSSGNDSWVYQREYGMLGSKLLAQKCMWNW